MGIIQQQSIRSSALIIVGFAIGAFNMLVLGPKILGSEMLGLTRIITDAGITLATLATFGTIPVIYKFYPFYSSYIPPKKNDLPFITGVICLIGFILICIAGYFCKDLIVRKYTERAPLFVEYSYLVYPFSLFMLAYMWLESFGWSFKKSIATNGLREIVPRLVFTVITILFAYSLLDNSSYLLLFSLSYILPVIALYFILRRTGKFQFVTSRSDVTRRLGKRMANFGLFIFGAHFLNLITKTVDTFILASVSKGGLADTAIFTIATYVVTLMEVPQRSLNAVTIPILAEAWKNKDMNSITNIYKKSVSNLLVLGLGMLSVFILNSKNLETYLGAEFSGVGMAMFIIGIGKLVDLGTGANTQIIGTSSFWKVDFATNVLYSLVALPLNYILISKYGLKGAAYSSLISITFYNLLRYSFLYFKFGLQPYNYKNLLAIMIASISGIAAYLIPSFENYIIDTFIRTGIFAVLFIPSIYFSKVSGEINTSIDNLLNKIR
jgi:O-antigen/teichoic acid export membrane protein